MGYHKNEKSLQGKGYHQQENKATYRMGKEFFTSSIFNRGLISKTYKKTQKANIKKSNNSIKIGYKSKNIILNRGISMIEKNLKKCSKSLAMRKM